MIYVHDLAGCAPTPLAHYLKALGILRLLAENKEHGDPEARGWWEGERFRLATRLDREGLESFFLERYEPTPIFNPWGGRSGFFPEGSEKSARQVLTAIEYSTAPRLDSYRAAVGTIRRVINSTSAGKKPKDEDKERLILALRHSVRGKSTLWMDSVASVVGTGDGLEVEHPALFGTGGNEGSGSYTSAYMAALDQCLLKRAWDHAVPIVLFGENKVPGCDWDQSMGQFLPEGAATPWDLLLAFEGACTVRSAVSSRNTTSSTRWMSSPFFVAPTSYGYPSEARLDEFALNKGKELPGRGEQWFPLWSQPMLFGEVNQMFVEGRATTKRRRATDGWSMVRAITSLGVRQGIREFVRYGYQQRNNLATHFAVPLGRFRVPERASPILACLDDLDDWLPGLHRQARSKEAAARLRNAERRLTDALFTVAQHPNEAIRWQAALPELAAVEGAQATGSGFKAGPVPKLRPEWVEAADDRSSELRLALSLALQRGGFDGKNADWWNTVRRHWLPLDKKNPRRFAISGNGSQARLQGGPEVVMPGRRGIDDALALVERRLIEASQRGERCLPMVAAWQASAHSADLAALITGEVDTDRTLALARAFMALDGWAWANHPMPPEPPNDDRQPDDAWLAIRLALLPWPLKSRHGAKFRIGADPAIFRRLASGDAATAVELALRRLRAAGITSGVRAATVPPDTAQIWAAALAFPITQQTARSFLRRLDPNQET
jgi:CRISPR-associated protein Csx17